jgi:hypothetical protein
MENEKGAAAADWNWADFGLVFFSSHPSPLFICTCSNKAFRSPFCHLGEKTGNAEWKRKEMGLLSNNVNFDSTLFALGSAYRSSEEH